MKVQSRPVGEHAEVPLSDDGRWEEVVRSGLERTAMQGSHARSSCPCYVVSISSSKDRIAAESQQLELCGLVEAQGDAVCGTETIVSSRRDPRTWISCGVAERIAAHAREAGAEMLVLDAELSPSQARNLEHLIGLAVCDREAVILNVFEKHATTRRARVQVELAHLEYLRPRIRGIGLDMDQQAGGLLGSRGPGETASELLARRLDARLAELRRTLQQLARAASEERSRRRDCARVALVGYTNAGKTSLMNALTEAGLSVRDRVFETLDATSRALSRHGGDIVISDTVGFIRRLPERLMASFETTLAEVSEASLLLWVLDCSDPEMRSHVDTTRAVLERLNAAEIPRLVVFNKLDRSNRPPGDEELAELAGGHPYALLSAHDPAAVARLRERIVCMARSADATREVFVRYGEPELVRRIHASCRVLRSHAAPTGTQFVVQGPAHVVRAIARASRRRSS